MTDRQRNPLARDGTSRRQRSPAALSPSFVRIDERGTLELLDYLARYARYLRYYDPSNQPAGDWVEFVENDVSTLLAQVALSGPEREQAAFQAQSRRAERADPGGYAHELAGLLKRVFRVAADLERWRRRAPKDLPFRPRLEQLTRSVLADALRRSVGHAKRLLKVHGPQTTGLAELVDVPGPLDFGDVWGTFDDAPPDGTLFPSGGLASAEERMEALHLVTRSFQQFDEARRRTISHARQLFTETISAYPKHRPHAALLLASLELLSHARDSLNTLTAKHLNFTLRDVLKLAPRPPEPSEVHVLFGLAKNAPDTRIPRGTALSADKDGAERNVQFVTTEEIVVNHAIIDPEHGLKSVFLERHQGVTETVRAAVDAATQDGVSMPLEGDEQSFCAFGTAALPPATLGFAIASPMLRLAEGQRKVRITLHFESGSDVRRNRSAEEVKAELIHNVAVQVSGEKGWIDLSLGTDLSVEDQRMVLPIEIGPDHPAVVPLDAKLHAVGFDTREPVLRFLLKSDGLPSTVLDDHGRRRVPLSASPYKYFERARLAQLELHVSVKNMRNLVVENDSGVLNAAKPFLPFGATPRSGSSFLIGATEALSKPLHNLTVGVEWWGLPANMSTYYQGYPGSASNLGEFRADFEALSGGKWVSLMSDENDASVELFTPPFEADEAGLKRLVPSPNGWKPQRFSTVLRDGFLHLKLKSGFGHDAFPLALAQWARNGGDPPNPPYTPTLSKLELCYSASETIDYATIGREALGSRTTRLFQIAPFGQREIVPAAAGRAQPDVAASAALVPTFEVSSAQPEVSAEGTFYIGLAGLRPPRVEGGGSATLSLLFQFAEGSEDLDAPRPPVRWSYLSRSGWLDFTRAQLLSDATRGFVASGIVRIEVPRDITNESALFPGKLHWLRVTVPENARALPKLIAVHPQAVVARFRDDDNDPEFLATPLPAGTITKLVKRNAAIKSVLQPYASFGGRTGEADPAFHVRAAERIRHRNRAVTVFDYERLVLERFRHVYKIRAVNHTDGGSEFAAGKVRLVVVPNLQNRNAVDPLKPRLSVAQMTEIAYYVRSLASDFVDVEVVKPEYEEVRVRFNVRFVDGKDKGHYTTLLDREIVRFLSPWAYADAVDLAFGGRMHRSFILNFVDGREYVDFVSDFEMDHIVAGVVHWDVEEAIATTSTAVLVSAPSHSIGDAVASGEDPPVGDGTSTQKPGRPRTARPPNRYLGNAHTRELHDLFNETPRCLIAKIAIDRRFPFRTVGAARALGYDLCAYCFGRKAPERLGARR